MGQTFTFDVVEDTGSNLTSNSFLAETLARAVPEDTPPCGFPGIETKRVGPRTAAYGTDAPKEPADQREGGGCRAG